MLGGKSRLAIPELRRNSAPGKRKPVAGSNPHAPHAIPEVRRNRTRILLTDHNCTISQQGWLSENTTPYFIWCRISHNPWFTTNVALYPSALAFINLPCGLCHMFQVCASLTSLLLLSGSASGRRTLSDQRLALPSTLEALAIKSHCGVARDLLDHISYDISIGKIDKVINRRLTSLASSRRRISRSKSSHPQRCRRQYMYDSINQKRTILKRKSHGGTSNAHTPTKARQLRP